MSKKNSVANTPADPTLPKTKLTLHGEDYWLCYDFNALATAESLTGLNMLDSMTFQNIGVNKIRALLFAAMLKFQPKITLEQVTSLMPHPAALGEYVHIVETLAKAYFGANNVEGVVENESPNVQAPESES